jgi:Asp-tRNA(Asn)/Glu-tRNA(Gln) amidotransferase A subunit family amidase
VEWRPIVNVPAGLNSQGMPIGVQIVGKPHDTKAALKVAYAYSKGGLKLYVGDAFPKAE